METTYITIGYSVYLPIALLLTYYVAHQLFKNSKVFMLEIFSGKTEIATSTNKLFEIGFYLINLGFAFLILKIKSAYFVDSAQVLIEILSVKIGGFSIYLGIMLFLNLYLFFRGRRISKRNKALKDIKKTEPPFDNYTM
ncbi:hypothetical protein [Parvicella tangerina]|uniref:Uncharacterized protein n=1 Tax=Parvicella tangerina TaxID=2829795 RepID=A0A916NAN5_9FLAO|nr:hypothetical protein [Parvicella tangerina]CAG5081087.1 hypothetical protein CRYO30217_01533 [Parvicella tangerina]